MTARGLLTKAAVVVVFLFLLVSYALALWGGIKYPPTTDFAKFFAAAEFLAAGLDPYTPVPLEALGPLPPGAEYTRDTLHPNLNLPIVTAVFVPLLPLGYAGAYAAWVAISLVCGVAAVWLAYSSLGGRSCLGIGPVGVLVLLLAYYPTWLGIKLGQVSLVLFLLLTLTWAAARKGDDGLAGVALGTALVLKVFVFPLLLYFMMAKRWRVVAFCSAVLAGALLASIALFGIDLHQTYLETLNDITWYGAAWNASILGFLSRFLGGTENVPAIDAPWLAYGITLGISLILLTVLALAARGHRVGFLQTCDGGVMLALTTMLLVAPLGWVYYFPVLLIGFLLLAAHAPVTHSIAVRGLVFAAFLLSAWPVPQVPARLQDEPVQWFISSPVYFYALALLLTTQLIVLFREGASGDRGAACG